MFNIIQQNYHIWIMQRSVKVKDSYRIRELERTFEFVGDIICFKLIYTGIIIVFLKII